MEFNFKALVQLGVLSKVEAHLQVSKLLGKRIRQISKICIDVFKISNETANYLYNGFAKREAEIKQLDAQSQSYYQSFIEVHQLLECITIQCNTRRKVL